MVGHGVPGTDQSVRTASAKGVQCATSVCHDIETAKEYRPRIREDYSHGIGGNPADPSAVNTVQTTGTWYTRSGSLRTGGRYSYSSQTDATHQITFTGTGIELISDKDPYRGKAEILIDGQSAGTIDLYAPLTALQQTVFAADGLEFGEHTITVRVTGQRNSAARAAFVVVDGYRVFSPEGGMTVPACTDCHEFDPDALHPPHDASDVVLDEPGSHFADLLPVTVLSEDFGTTGEWPSAWSRSSTDHVRVQNQRARSGYAAEIFHPTWGMRTDSLWRDVDLSGYSGTAQLSFWMQANVNVDHDAAYFWVEHSVDGGQSWVRELALVVANTGWTRYALDLPAGGTVRVKFGSLLYTSPNRVTIDDVRITAYKSAIGSAGSTAAASCQNNPNGAECHIVSCAAELHGGLPDEGCPTCHDESATKTFDCQTSGCHPSVNLDQHIQTGSGTPAHHESAMSNPAVFGTGFAASWCTACHDDSIANEHFVLDAYHDTPCSVCHDKTSNSGAPTNVTAANTAAAIAKAPGTALCTDCHKTVTKSRPHVQRWGWNGLPHTGSSAIGAVQFNDNWSGHRVYDSMPGMKTSFTPAVDGVSTNRTWSLPTASSFLLGSRTATSLVRCVDCHGSVSGASGPHGATMHVRMAEGYTNDYSTGGTYLTSTAPHIRSASGGTPLCAKCHQTAGVYGANQAHADVRHGNLPCVSCHVKIPHAWKRPRLLGYTSDPEPFRSLYLNNVTDKSYTPANWDVGNCGVACDPG